MIPLYSSTIRRREMDAVLTCMVDEKIGPGEVNARLAEGIKDFFGCSGAVPLRSPSIALCYALKAIGAEAGTKVMISALSPAWQIITIERAGFTPLILDVDEENALITVEGVEQGMKEGGRVLLLHETCGLLPDMEGISALGVPIIEDISQSTGAVFSAAEEEGKDESVKRKAGSFGVYAILGMEEHDGVTAGGGAALIAFHRRDWMPIKSLAESAPPTDLLPDLNSALALVEIKEFKKNEERRKEIFDLYVRAVMQSGNKTFFHDSEKDVAVSFPVVLSHSYKDAKQYADKKEVEIRRAFEGSVIAVRDEGEGEKCKNAKSLLLRTVLFPLYARLTSPQIQKIVKVIGTLP